MGKKFYAVKKGINTGIYTTWDECKKNTQGFSGAVFKGFETLDEARMYMTSENKPVEKAEACAYVDGSYNADTKEFSYGVVMFYNGSEEHFNRRFDDKELATMRNVAGELEGAKCAMQYCVDRGISSVDIYFDYEGIEKWCTGDWKTNKDGTRAYKEFYDSIKTKVKVNFNKVKGHSGDTYNELADSLAKQALGL